jgi:type I restriction enzyme S subunit
MVPLSEVATINPRMPKELRADIDRDVSFLPMATVKENGQVGEVETKNLGDVVKGYTYFERGDVLFAKITPCFENGKATYLDSLPFEVGFGSTEFHVLRPTDRVNGRYLFHMVWNPTFRFLAARAMTGAAGQKRVPTPFVKDFKIPLPSLTEQKRIAAILDKADAIRRKRQDAIELADTFLRSVFLKMFGDPVTNPMGWDQALLKDVASIGGGVTKGKKYKGLELVDVPYMRVANVQDGWIDTSEMKTISVSHADAERYSMEKGDLLLTEGGDPDKLGRGAVWDGSISPCIHQNHIFKVRFDTSVVLPEFASFLIGSIRGKRYFLRAAKQTTGIATINKTQLSNFEMLVPGIELQKQFQAAVQSAKSTKQKLEQNSGESNNLFSSLQQRAFRGDL